MASFRGGMYLVYFILSIVLVVAATAPTNPVKNVTDCSCGYYDHSTHNLFTESIIVYFNETAGIPVDTFLPQSYKNSHEKGWNTQYCQGATASNVHVGRDLLDGASNNSLELFVDPATPAHLVIGGGVQTVRQDMFYGSFRMLLRSPTMLGSSLSMMLVWNDTQGITTNVQSTDEYSTAWVSTLSGDEFPDRKLGVNYTVLSNSSNNISPWDYTEYRVDWTPKQVNWTIGGKLFRQLNKTSDNTFPQTPVPLILKHWSVGNYFSMQGPPASRSVANVGWVRLFFNSSLATEEDSQDFVLRCQLKDACTMDDTTLRGDSSYDPAATLKWKQIQKPRDNKEAATMILIICGTVSFALIVNALARRLPWEKFWRSQPAAEVNKEKMVHTSQYSPSVRLTAEEATFTPVGPDSRVMSFYANTASTVSSTPRRLSRRPSSESPSIYWVNVSLEDDAPREQNKSTRVQWREHSHGLCEAQPCMASENPRSPAESINGDEIPEAHEETRFIESMEDSGVASGKFTGPSVTIAPVLLTPEAPAGDALRTNMLGYNEIPTANPNTADDIDSPSAGLKAVDFAAPNYTAPLNLPATKKRVDYLAGLVALSCMLVTAIHFCLTFAPAAINPGAFVHYDSEVWARKTIDSYFLNLIWIGPFLMTSTRFLVSNYLKNGNLLNVAEKVVGRPFRLLVPILAISMLEYFFMDSGATAWLQYLPSVTWSTWPFTTVPDNFGHYISEILELAYLIPNAAPQITFNYCTGVLWTIPVQLQGSWVTLLAVIVIREVKRPWKRFGFYSFCILMHWYALSWGTYFYLAILLTDLDITFKYRKWLSAHKFVYYPLIMLCAFLGFGGLSLDMVSQWTQVNYATYEYGIHPDIPTGLPIMLTGGAGYPQYYVPKAHGIVFSLGFQALVELSPLVQKFFSFKFLIYVFPHIFTIYLIHGFIFWSIGSTLCVYLAGRGIPYWLNILTVAICCYATLIASLPLLTPIVETLGKHITANIWQFASEKPAPRRPTLFPFPDDFLFVRRFAEQEDEQKGRQLSEDMVTRKQRSSFRRFMASVATSVDPHFTNQQSQPGDLASTCAISRSESGGGRPTTPRNVGWRTGPLSGNVEVLRRNNSSAKDNKSTRSNNSAEHAPRQ